MAVDSVKPLKTKLSVDAEGHRTYTVKYLAITDRSTSPVELLKDSKVPQRFDQYYWKPDTNSTPKYDEWANCKTVAIDEAESCRDGSDRKIKWMLSVTFSTKLDRDVPQYRENPLDDPPIIDGDFSPHRVTVFVDKDYEPLLTTANEKLKPGAEIDDAYDTLRISFKTAYIDLQERTQFRGSVNGTPIWGLQPRQAKLTKWRWKAVRVGMNDYYVQHDMEFVISFKPTPVSARIANETDPPTLGSKMGWYTIRRNEGTFYYEGGDPTDPTTKRSFRTGEGDEVETGFLDEDGDQLSDNANPLYLVFKVEPERDFTQIDGLPFPRLPGPFV